MNIINKNNNSGELLYKHILGDQQFTMLDIGARGGVDDVWENVKNIVHFVLFEPEEEQSIKLKN